VLGVPQKICENRLSDAPQPGNGLMENLEWRKASGVGICNYAGDKFVEAWGLGPDRLQPLSRQELQDQPGSNLVQTGVSESDFC